MITAYYGLVTKNERGYRFDFADFPGLYVQEDDLEALEAEARLALFIHCRGLPEGTLPPEPTNPWEIGEHPGASVLPVEFDDYQDVIDALEDEFDDDAAASGPSLGQVKGNHISLFSGNTVDLRWIALALVISALIAKLL